MRALICSELKGFDGLELGDLPAPELKPGTVRVEVAAAGVNYPDLLLIRGMYQEQPPLPFAPGMEIAGTVSEVAADVTGISVGDRVTGMSGHGGFAEEAVVPAERLVPLPDPIGFEEGAAFPITYGTSYHALVDRAELAKDETLLVLGAAGGVGLSAVQIGSALGAHVIGAVSSKEKAQVVTEAGARSVIRYDREDLRTALKSMVPGGVDVVYDPVGGDATEAAFRSLAWRGRHLVVGFAAGTIPSLPVNLALLKGSSLVGVFWGSFTAEESEQSRADFGALFEWWLDGRIEPRVSEVFPLDDAIEALRMVEDRRAVGKLVVRI